MGPCPEVQGRGLGRTRRVPSRRAAPLDVAGVDGVAHRPDHPTAEGDHADTYDVQASTVGNCVSQNMPYAMPAAAGMVRTHAVTISPTTFQLAPLRGDPSADHRAGGGLGRGDRRTHRGSTEDRGGGAEVDRRAGVGVQR